MHTTDAAHSAVRPMIGKIEKGQLVAAAHVEKDMGRSWLVAVTHDAGQAHPQFFGIETDRGVEIGADEREMIDPTRWYRWRIRQGFRQIARRQLFAPPFVEIEFLHDRLRDRKRHAPNVIDKR